MKQNQNTNPWTAEQLALLKKMRHDDAPWEEIAVACGHPVNSCRVTHSKHHHAKNKWTDDDVRRLQRLRDVDNMDFPAIGRAMGRTPASCHAKYWAIINARLVYGAREAGSRIDISPEAIADREARYEFVRTILTAAGAAGVF